MRKRAGESGDGEPFFFFFLGRETKIRQWVHISGNRFSSEEQPDWSSGSAAGERASIQFTCLNVLTLTFITEPDNWDK